MFTRKTKIVCSIGPACDNDETIRKMIRAGMNIARFNFSHGSYEWHKSAMERVRRISEEIDIPVGILLDTKGPEIRTGLVENDGKIEIRTGEKIELSSLFENITPYFCIFFLFMYFTLNYLLVWCSVFCFCVFKEVFIY